MAEYFGMSVNLLTWLFFYMSPLKSLDYLNSRLLISTKFIVWRGTYEAVFLNRQNLIFFWKHFNCFCMRLNIFTNKISNFLLPLRAERTGSVNFDIPLLFPFSPFNFKVFCLKQFSKLPRRAITLVIIFWKFAVPAQAWFTTSKRVLDIHYSVIDFTSEFSSFSSLVAVLSNSLKLYFINNFERMFDQPPGIDRTEHYLMFRWFF